MIPLFLNLGGIALILVLITIVFLVWLLPIIIVAVSKKEVSGSERLAWILAVIFISWFAWIFFLLLAPVKKDR